MDYKSGSNKINKIDGLILQSILGETIHELLKSLFKNINFDLLNHVEEFNHYFIYYVCTYVFHNNYFIFITIISYKMTIYTYIMDYR